MCVYIADALGLVPCHLTLLVTVALLQDKLQLREYVVASLAAGEQAYAQAMFDSVNASTRLNPHWVRLVCSRVRRVTATAFEAAYLTPLNDPAFASAVQDALDSFFKKGVVAVGRCEWRVCVLLRACEAQPRHGCVPEVRLRGAPADWCCVDMCVSLCAPRFADVPVVAPTSRSGSDDGIAGAGAVAGGTWSHGHVASTRYMLNFAPVPVPVAIVCACCSCQWLPQLPVPDCL